MSKSKISQVAEIVRKKFEGESSGHDWWHMYRVWNLSKQIGSTENANMLIVELGALLHDIAEYETFSTIWHTALMMFSSTSSDSKIFRASRGPAVVSPS